MSRFIFIGGLLFLFNLYLVCSSCNPSDRDFDRFSAGPLAKAICILQGQASGKLSLEELSDGTTKIYGFVTNIAPGKHGFHVHQYGDLRNKCKNTGGHYNPFKYMHASPSDKKRHVGDLGNINAGQGRWSEVHIIDKQVKLLGEHSIIGRAIVVHQLEDDLGTGIDAGSLSTGNAGARVGCCVIGRAK